MNNNSSFRSVFKKFRNFAAGARFKQVQKAKSITYFAFTILLIVFSTPLLVNNQAANSPNSPKPKLNINDDDDTRLKHCIDEILKALTSTDQVDLDEENRKARGKPWNSYHKITDIPLAVVTPNTTEEVSKIMTICSTYKIPIVPYGELCFVITVLCNLESV